MPSTLGRGRLAPVRLRRMELRMVQETVVHTLTRVEAQRAVGRTSIGDVLKSLKRAGLVQRYRVGPEVVTVEAPSTLTFLVGAFGCGG